MSGSPSRSCTAFLGHRRLLSGALVDVALAVRAALAGNPDEAVLVFDDKTGLVVDLDLRGSDADLVERLSRPAQALTGRDGAVVSIDEPSPADGGQAQRGRGRPRLGVVAREVTLLPRHWEWLGEQPGGASAALRRLVDEARRAGTTRQARRSAQEAAYNFIHAVAGDFAGYEEATRALFAGDRARLEDRVADWPQDIRAHALRLAFPDQHTRS